MSPILLVDLSALFYKYWHATKSGPQSYEFTIDHLTELVSQYPRMVICCEGKRPIRFDWFPAYKANREAKPEEVKESLRQIIRELSETPGIPVISIDHLEADDVIATLATQATEPVHILSRDKDLYALLSPLVSMVIDGKLVGPAECFEKFGVRPDQIRDYLAMVGDVADNIPGCSHAGPGRVAKLLSKFGTIGGILNATDDEITSIRGIADSTLKGIRAWDPTLAIKLTTLITDAPIDINDLFPNQESEADMADMSKIVTQRKGGPLKIVAYGPEGVGKTRFGAFSNKPIFLCAENGLSAPDLRDVPAFPTPDSWVDVLTAIDWLRTQKHEYRTLVVDSLDWLYKHVKEAIKLREKMSEADFESYGRGEKFALDFWTKLTDAFDALQAANGMHIIVLAHCQSKMFANPQGEDFARFQLALADKATERWKQWPDFLLFMSQEIFTKKSKDDKNAKGIIGGHRIFTERTAAFDAKNRINLPAEIPYETVNPWAAFVDAVKATMPKAVVVAPVAPATDSNPATGSTAAA